MKKNRLEHQKDLFKKLIENESFKNEVRALRAGIKNSAWWASETGDKITALSPNEPHWGPRRLGITERDKKIRRAIKKVKKSKTFARFDCGCEISGVCVPIIQGDKIYGYVITLSPIDEISQNIILIFSNFLDTLIRELQKELELAKLYKTIRPRAIALSTIHTIHRIISATLNLDELVPKIARLCLQIFRAEKCCIFLKGPPKKHLIITAGDKTLKNKQAPHNEKRFREMLCKNRILSRGNILMAKDRLCVPLAEENIIGALCIANKLDKAPFDEFDREILLTLSEQAVVAIKNAKLYKEQEDITLGSIKSMADILSTRTSGIYKIKESCIKIVLAIGNELNLNSEDLRNLHYAAIIHDAGQIGFPDKLLEKTEKLTGEEYNLIKKHPHKSVSIIRHLGFLKPLKPIILHHHENYDGTGYPNGLKGDKIPLGARIMAVATVFNAMITKRPYRREVNVKSAIAEIKKNAGTQFDPRVVKAFLKVIRNNEISSLIEKGL